jgi:hypothetical protein
MGRQTRIPANLFEAVRDGKMRQAAAAREAGVTRQAFEQAYRTFRVQQLRRELILKRASEGAELYDVLFGVHKVGEVNESGGVWRWRLHFARPGETIDRRGRSKSLDAAEASLRAAWDQLKPSQSE